MVTGILIERNNLRRSPQPVRTKRRWRASRLNRSAARQTRAQHRAERNASGPCAQAQKRPYRPGESEDGGYSRYQQSLRAYSWLSTVPLGTAFGGANRARAFRRTVTCNWKSMAFRTLKTVLKFECLASPSKYHFSDLIDRHDECQLVSRPGCGSYPFLVFPG